MKKLALLFFTFGFLFLETAAQTNWTVVSKGLPYDLNTVFFVNGQRGWIGGDNGYLSLTNDGGASWAKQQLKSTSNINEVYFRNSENGFILAGRQVFATSDGSSWSEIRVLNPALFLGMEPELYSIRFADKKKGWIVGSVSQDEKVMDSLLMQTEDGGNTWRRVSLANKEELIHLDFVNESKGWIVGARGLILATEDGGITWKKQRSETTATIYNVDFRNSNDGIAVGEKGLILRTDDGGKYWQKISTNFKNTFLRISYPDDKSIWIAGRGGSILRSADKGITWIKQDSKTTENLFGFFADKKMGVAVGAKGIILKYQK